MIGYFLPRHNRPFHSPYQWCQQQQEKKERDWGVPYIYVMEGWERARTFTSESVILSNSRVIGVAQITHRFDYIFFHLLYIHTCHTYTIWTSLRLSSVYYVLYTWDICRWDECGRGIVVETRGRHEISALISIFFFLFLVWCCSPLSASLYNSTRASWGEK